jgi:hypothetical protein
MAIKFRDLYNTMVGTETAFARMGVDIDNARCGMPKCVMTNAQEDLLESYMDMANIDLDFCELDFQGIIKRITECFDCVTDEFKGLLPLPLPTPAESVDSCALWATNVVPLEHIKRFRIYERTYTNASIISPVQVYVVEKTHLPYSFEPSVPEQYSSLEKYTVNWNVERQSLVIKVDHSKFPDSMGAPTGSFNISLVVAEYTTEVADGIYEGFEVYACSAMLMTPGVTWVADHGLIKSVDGDYSTYPSYAGTPQEVVVEYQFRT